MAEGWGNHFADDIWEVYSAGKNPLGYISPDAITAMSEYNIDISEQHSKGIEEVPYEDLDIFVSMGCGPTKSFLPSFSKDAYDWEIDDPYELGIENFRQVANVLREKIENLSETYRQKLNL
jgi:arsenate reductase